MTEQSISDFNPLTQSKRDAQIDLGDRLTHLYELLSFILNTDLCNVKPTELHAQLLSLSKGIEVAVALNEQISNRFPGDLTPLVLESDEEQID